MSHFCGRILGRHECAGLFLTELRYDSPILVPRHSHKLAFFRLLLDGSYAERCGPAAASYLPFSVLFHPPGVEHQDEVGENGAHFFSIEMDESWLDRVGRRHFADAPLTDLHGGDLLWLSLQLYREYARLPNPFAGLAMKGLAMELLATAARASGGVSLSRGPRWFQRVFAQLHERFTGNITLNQLASTAGVHPVHLSRVFQRFTGRTFGEILQRLRVQFACRRLSDPSTTLSQIAIEAGFSDQSHFTHVFREVAGMTPGVFRNLLPDRESFNRFPSRPRHTAIRPLIATTRPAQALFAARPR